MKNSSQNKKQKVQKKFLYTITNNNSVITEQSQMSLKNERGEPNGSPK